MEQIPGITPEKAQRLKKRFYKYDINGDGTIDEREMCAAIRNIGGKKSKEEISQIFKEVSPDGPLTLSGFLKMFGHEEAVNHLREVFQRTAKSKKTKVTVHELGNLLGKDRVREIYQRTTKKLSDDLSFEEFVALVTFASPLKKLEITSRIPGAENLDAGSIAKARQMFFKMDRNQDGTLSAKELYRLLGKAGVVVSRDQVQQLIDQVDRDGDQELSLIEFMELMGHDPEIALYWEAFMILDQEESGTLSKRDMARGMKAMGLSHTKRRTEKLFKEQGIKEMNFERFVEWMVRMDDDEHYDE